MSRAVILVVSAGKGVPLGNTESSVARPPGPTISMNNVCGRGGAEGTSPCLTANSGVSVSINRPCPSRA